MKDAYCGIMFRRMSRIGKFSSILEAVYDTISHCIRISHTPLCKVATIWNFVLVLHWLFFNARVSTQYVFDDDKTYDNKIRYLELCASYT